MLTLNQRNKDLKRYEGYYRKTGDKKYLAVAHSISFIELHHKNICPNCGNPEKMYWCDDCEQHQAHAGECENYSVDNPDKEGFCGVYWVELDGDYHLNCNK